MRKTILSTKNFTSYSKLLLLFSLFLNLVLFVLIFPSNQTRVRFFLIKIFGYFTPNEVPETKNFLLLKEFQPSQELETTYTAIKYPSMPFIESHGHLGAYFQTTKKGTSEALGQVPIRYFINLSLKHGEEFLNLKQEYNDPKILHFSTFNWKRVQESDHFAELILNDLKEDIKNGTKGIKLWKDFGLFIKKRNGERLKLNDPSLDLVFQECAKSNLVISIHTADPKAFFKPIDEKNERYLELMNRPEWSFVGKEFPKFEELLKEREELFKRHPNLTFIALHFGELAHNLKEADRLLRENPNVYFDIAARIDELGRQPYSTREFFMKWQDRILFGTDGPIDFGKLEIYARFLETKDEYFDYHPPHKPKKGFWKIYGVGLPKDVLEKIYYKNALRIFKI